MRLIDGSLGLTVLFASALSPSISLPADRSVIQVAQKSWEQQAEETFRLGPGMGRRLMTQNEWQEHQREMQRLSPQDRERYRQEWHEKMSERAKEKGVTMPKSAGPHRGEVDAERGMGPGGGMGGGGRR